MIRSYAIVNEVLKELEGKILIFLIMELIEKGIS
jgi:hypothetical protein